MGSLNFPCLYSYLISFKNYKSYFLKHICICNLFSINRYNDATGYNILTMPQRTYSYRMASESGNDNKSVITDPVYWWVASTLCHIYFYFPLYTAAFCVSVNNTNKSSIFRCKHFTAGTLE